MREPFDLSFRRVTKVEAAVGETSSSWFDMSLKIGHGDQSFDLLPLVIEWLQGESRESSMLLQADGGEWLEVPPEVLAPVAETLLELYETPPEGPRLRLPRERVGELDALGARWGGDGVEVRWHDARELFALAERLRDFSGIERPELGDAVQATLREYQLDGVAWLGFLAEFGFNGILADDMGLGKTLQALSHVAHERAAGRLTRPTLVVAPTSLLGNWRRETARFCPQLSTLVWHGAERRENVARLATTDVVITSYALVTRDIVLLGQQDFGLVVLDEAQAIKNPSAKVTQALKTLEVRRRLCLTGTPLENHLGELWSLFDFLMPGFLGTRKRFNRFYRTPIETHGSDERQAALVALVRPFLLRRRKEQVATELPPKTEIVREVTLEPEQARLYESIRVSMEHRVRALLAERGLGRSHIEMLDALLKLRQTCCHPRLVKLDSARGVTASAKTELALSMLEELVDEGKKILLFSQFTEMLALIERELEKRELSWVKLTGRTRDRDAVIDAFQHGDVPIFLISLKAGGTGLNLTAADTVIHYDPWWNPAVENQASDRAHRIGQDKPGVHLQARGERHRRAEDHGDAGAQAHAGRPHRGRRRRRRARGPERRRRAGPVRARRGRGRRRLSRRPGGRTGRHGGRQGSSRTVPMKLGFSNVRSMSMLPREGCHQPHLTSRSSPSRSSLTCTSKPIVVSTSMSKVASGRRSS